MKLSKYWVTVLFIALTVTSNVSAVHAASAREHARAANAAGKAGDWTNARKQWAQALENAQREGSPAKLLAVFNYEYGRALGVQCFWDEAEKHLLKAFELDQQTGGPAFISLVELARLRYDQKQYDKCVPYFKRAIEALEKMSAATESPAEFSVILDEYAVALRGIGNEQEATSVQGRAKEIRSKYPGGYSVTDRTPYGKHCAKEE